MEDGKLQVGGWETSSFVAHCGSFVACGSSWLTHVANSLVWGKGKGGNTWPIFQKSWLIRQIYVAKTSSGAGFCITVVQGSAST